MDNILDRVGLEVEPSATKFQRLTAHAAHPGGVVYFVCAVVGPTRRLVAWIPRDCRTGCLAAAGQVMLSWLRTRLWALLEDWWPGFLEAAGLAAWQLLTR